MKERSNILDITTLTPNYIGFIFYHASIRFVGKNFFLPKFKTCKKVGVFVNATANYVFSISRMHKLDFVQLHGNESPKYCANIMNKGIKIIKAFGINEDFQFDQIKLFHNVCNYVLFDSHTMTYGGSGQKFNWNKINEYNIEIPFFISGGISIYNIEDILTIRHPLLFGIDINSKFENAPGIKDFNKVKKFIQTIRV